MTLADEDANSIRKLEVRPNFGWEIRKILPENFGKSSSVLGKFLLNIKKIHPQNTGSRRQNHLLQLWATLGTMHAN